MPIPKYENRGPVIATSNFDLENLEGKSVIITGGANGLGKAYAKAFVAAGAYVTIGDVNPFLGRQTVAGLGPNSQFIPCEVQNWDQQVLLFEEAIKNSPNKSCDIVIANAGIMGNGDPLASAKDDPSQAPIKPDFTVIEVNQTGVLYTAHLAMHYCRREGKGEKGGDKCLIIVSSLAGYTDQRGTLQYSISKNAGRVVMRTLRQGAWETGVRVNCIAPWLIYTDLVPRGARTWWDANDLGRAEVEDAVKAILKMTTDTSVNGRSLAVLPRNLAPEGYLDVDHDDLADGVIKTLDSKVTAAIEKSKARTGEKVQKARRGNTTEKL